MRRLFIVSEFSVKMLIRSNKRCGVTFSPLSREKARLLVNAMNQEVHLRCNDIMANVIKKELGFELESSQVMPQVLSNDALIIANFHSDLVFDDKHVILYWYGMCTC